MTRLRDTDQLLRRRPDKTNAKPDRIWWFDSEDQFFEAMDLIEEMHYNAQIGRTDEVQRLQDCLQSLPGFPTHARGDHIEARIRRKTYSLSVLSKGEIIH